MNDRLSRDQILTIPNLLSFLRIGLAIVFCVLFDSSKTMADNWPAFVVLGLNALSDFLDGKLARALDQVSELGKVLDPVADYLTKFALILCFVEKYHGVVGLLLLFLARVFIVAYAGWKTVRLVGQNDGAILIGKLDTAVFYAVMLALVVFPHMPRPLAYTLVCVSAVMMLLAIILYLRHFARLRRNYKQKQSQTKP